MHDGSRRRWRNELEKTSDREKRGISGSKIIVKKRKGFQYSPEKWKNHSSSGTFLFLFFSFGDGSGGAPCIEHGWLVGPGWSA